MAASLTTSSLCGPSSQLLCADRRKRVKSFVPGLTSSPYFTHADVDSERWFKKLCLLSEEAVARGEPAVVREESTCEAVLPLVPRSDFAHMPFALRTAIRFSSFRIAHPRVSVCPPVDDAAGNDTVEWLVGQKEPKLQWSMLQLI